MHKASNTRFGLQCRPSACLGWLLYVSLATWFMTFSPHLCFGQDNPGPNDTEPEIEWRTGNELNQFSKDPVSVSWQHSQLGPQLASFARSQKLAIVLDRRIDRNQSLDLIAKNVSVEQLMLRIAQDCGGSFCRFGDCYYIGPTETARRLLAIDAILSSGPKASRWSRKAPGSWELLSTPQEILAKWSEENDFKVDQLEKIEHDLLAATELPPLRLDMRLALLLSQFDLWFRQNKNEPGITIVDPPRTLTATLQLTGYDVDRELLKRVRAAAPDCTVGKTGKAVSIKGPADGLEAARNVIIASWKPELPELDKKRFQLKVRSERGQVLNAVAQQLSLEVLVAKDCHAMLKDIVTVEVKDATVAELLDAILAGTSCTYSLEPEAQTLKVFRQ